MVSFQCSRHATAEGIINVFKDCASFQQGKSLDKFVSVVVLDEVGLAEDSENMPLKVNKPFKISYNGRLTCTIFFLFDEFHL